MELAILVKLFGPTFARILFAYALRGKINLDFIESGDIAETLADSLDIGGIVDKLTDGNRKAIRSADFIFDEIGDEIAKTVATSFENSEQSLTPTEQDEVVEAAKEMMNRNALPLLVNSRFELPKFQQDLRQIYPESKGWWTKEQNAFYKELMNLSSDYLFAAAEQIPHFTRDTTAQLLKDNVSLLEGMRKGLENQEQILKQTYGHQQETQHQRFEVDYRTQLASALDELKMFGVSRLDGARQPLTVAFVKMELAHTRQEKQEDEQAAQLNLLPAEGGDEAFAKREAKYKNLFQPDHDKPVSVNDAFANNRRLVVVARAGFGKTTLLKWAAVQIARNMPDSDVPQWQNRIPFFVQMRDYINRDLPVIADLPFGLVDKTQITLLKGSEPDGWAMEQIRAKRAVIFLDGLDEVNEKKRQDALNWVENILELEPDTVMVLAGRPSAIDREKTQPELVQLGFQFVTLKPMDETMTLAFVRQWHDAIAHPNCKYPDKARVPERQENLLHAFTYRWELQDLAETPLVCAMLCALNLTELSELPQDRIRLYDRCIDLMLTRDEARAVDVSDYGEPLRPDSVKKHLGHIAFWMMEHEQSTIKRKDAVRLVNSEDLDGSRIVRYLTERSGLLQKQSEYVFDFLHRTFQEFLAAKYIVLRNEVGKVIDLYAGKKLWRETIGFIAGVSVDSDDQNQVLDILLTKAKENEGQALSLHLLAWEFWQLLDQVTGKANKLIQHHVLGLCDNNGYSLTMLSDSIQKFPKLAFFPNLRSLDLSFTQIADVSTLSVLSNLQHLYLSNTQVTDISVLANLSNLIDLDLGWSKVTDVSMLTTLSNLLSLRLSFTSVNNIEALASLSTLRTLSINGTQVLDISPLARLPKLQYIDLSETQIADVSMLATLSTLRVLNLNGTQITNLSPLKQLITRGTIIRLSEQQLIRNKQQLKNYENLNLSLSDIKNTNHLSTLSNLQFLDLSDTQVTDLSPLAALSSLQKLNLDRTQVIDVSPLAALSNLQFLSLNKTQVTDVSPLARLSNLQKLYLTGTPVGDISVLDNLKGLEVIRVYRKVKQ